MTAGGYGSNLSDRIDDLLITRDHETPAQASRLLATQPMQYMIPRQLQSGIPRE
jgi:hypothetical protein